MHVQTHLLAGWCVGNLFPSLNARQRVGCMIAAAVADLDGVGIVVSQEMYWRFHHVVGHGIVFGVVASAALWMVTGGGVLVGLLYLGLFHLHLLMDYFGSGSGWGFEYWWPFSRGVVKCECGWELYSWQNILVFCVLLGWTVWIAWRKGRTPLEGWMPGLDGKLVGMLGGDNAQHSKENVERSTSNVQRPRQGDGRVHGVVIAVRRPGDGKWLAIRRGAGVAMPLKVCFPGGAVEVGESYEEAVVREAWEEVGLVVRPVKNIWRWESPTGPLTLFGWVGEVEDWSTLKADPGEVAEILWVTAEELPGHPDALETNREFCACLTGYLGGDTRDGYGR